MRPPSHREWPSGRRASPIAFAAIGHSARAGCPPPRRGRAALDRNSPGSRPEPGLMISGFAARAHDAGLMRRCPHRTTAALSSPGRGPSRSAAAGNRRPSTTSSSRYSNVAARRCHGSRRCRGRAAAGAAGARVCTLRRRSAGREQTHRKAHACPVDFAKPAVVVAANRRQRQPLQLGHGFTGP